MRLRFHLQLYPSSIQAKQVTIWLLDLHQTGDSGRVLLNHKSNLTRHPLEPQCGKQNKDIYFAKVRPKLSFLLALEMSLVCSIDSWLTKRHYWIIIWGERNCQTPVQVQVRSRSSLWSGFFYSYLLYISRSGVHISLGWILILSMPPYSVTFQFSW